MHKFKISAATSPCDMRIEMDGDQIGGVTDVVVKMSVGDVPTVTLTLYASEVEIDGTAGDLILMKPAGDPDPKT